MTVDLLVIPFLVLCLLLFAGVAIPVFVGGILLSRRLLKDSIEPR